MSLISFDDPKKESFELPNGMVIHMDYGYIFNEEHDMPTGYMPSFNRCSAQYRRSQLIDSNNKKIISEVIVKNPDRISKSQEERLLQEHLIRGDEFEKVVNFPDGKVAKIEYWLTPERRDENFGRYSANYRRSVLFDESGKIISEVMERNPNFRRSCNKWVEDSQDDADECLY